MCFLDTPSLELAYLQLGMEVLNKGLGWMSSQWLPGVFGVQVVWMLAR